jgi:hypothetical protein
MSRGSTTNKFQAIRELFAELGLDTLPKRIVARLTKRGVKVTGQTVSMIKLRLRQQAARDGESTAGAAPEAPARSPQQSPGLVAGVGDELVNGGQGSEARPRRRGGPAAPGPCVAASLPHTDAGRPPQFSP